jgi:signal transduction histidine kinase
MWRRLTAPLRALATGDSLQLRETALLILLAEGIAAAALLINGSYVTNFAVDNAVEQAHHTSERVYHAVSDTLTLKPLPTASPHAAVQGDDGLRALLESSVDDSWFVCAASVLDTQGHAVLHADDPSAAADDQQPPADVSLAELGSSGTASRLWKVFAAAGPFEYTVPLALDRDGQRENFGEVRVAVSANRLRAAIAQPLLANSALLLVSIFAAVLVAAVSTKFLLRPLESLSESIEQIGSGDVNVVRAATELTGSVRLNDPLKGVTNRLRQLGERLAGERAELEMTRGRLRQVMGSLEDHVLLVNPEFGIIVASPQSGALLGLDRRDLVGLRLPDVLGPQHPVVWIAQETLTKRRPVDRRPIPVGAPGPDGKPREVLVAAQYIEDEGQPVGALVSLRDAEPLHKLEAHVDYANKLAQLSRITSGVSHEIKNPLNGMAIHLEILRSKLETGSGDPTPQLDVLEEQIKRLDRVVKTFLDFTRPVEVRLEPHDLNDVVEHVLRLASAEAEARGVRLVQQLVPGPLPIKADADMLAQALLNIAINGCQAMPAGGPLRVVTSRVDDRRVRVQIQDSGVGIAPEAREKIFNLYYTTKEGGSGIGLAQAFRAVQIHNGHIDLTSQPGRGTTFTITLPEAG